MKKDKGDLSILTLSEKLRTEADAYLFLEELRWGSKPVCPHCGSVEKMYFLRPANGASRKTRTGTDSQRRVWKCAACRKQFSVLTGTIFHGTKIPVRTWVFVVFELCSSKNGVAAREIERKYDLTPKTAWHMLHRIRFAMERDPLAGLLSGRVVADETWYGGKPSNRHGHKRGKGGQGKTDKTPILSLVSPRAPGPLPRGVRLPLLDAQIQRQRPHGDAGSAGRRQAPDLPQARGRVVAIGGPQW